MKKSLANQIAKLWNESLAGGYEPTKTKAEVKHDGVGNYSVEVRPYSEENNGLSFHHIKELAGIERVFVVNAYIMIGRDGKLLARIF
jgi:hypothetical protein